MAIAKDPPLLPGSTLDGKYAVENVIGEGGMGVVMAARHLGLGSRVAIKVMRTDLLGSEEAVLRFDREARAAVTLTSDHVARVVDVGRTPQGAPYIVMEYLSGSDLRDLAHAKKLTVREIIALALDVCDALADAHRQGIIHRDLKPENVFVVDKPNGEKSAKVLDFGIAKIDPSIAGGTSLTTTGSMLGTPWYMAPEQLDTKRGVTTKSDVWSLGATIYNALTLKPPFQADSFYELSVKIYAHEPTPITTYRPDLDPAIVDVVHGCLQKDPDRRLPLDEVARRLEAILEHLDGVPESEAETHINANALQLQQSLRRSGERGGPVTAEARPLPPETQAQPPRTPISAKRTARLDEALGGLTPTRGISYVPAPASSTRQMATPSPRGYVHTPASMPPPAPGSVPNVALGPNIGTVTPYVTPQGPPQPPAPSVAPWLGVAAALAIAGLGLVGIVVLRSKEPRDTTDPAAATNVPVPVPVPVPDPTVTAPAATVTGTATATTTATLLGVSPPPPEPPQPVPPPSASAPQPPSTTPTGRATIRRPPPPAPPPTRPPAPPPSSNNGALTHER